LAGVEVDGDDAVHAHLLFQKEKGREGGKEK